MSSGSNTPNLQSPTVNMPMTKLYRSAIEQMLKSTRRYTHGTFSSLRSGGSCMILPPFQGFKDRIAICARPLSPYQNPSTCDNTDMADLILPNGRFVPVVTKFKYLGSYISSDGSDTIDVQSRIDSAARAFGSQNIDRKAKSAIYESLILSICLYGLSLIHI